MEKNSKKNERNDISPKTKTLKKNTHKKNHAKSQLKNNKKR